MKTPGKRLYICFVDLKKAFDSVWREGLLYKLLSTGIGGSFFNIIQNMYSKCKFHVKLDDGLTHEFETNIGVKQGYVISPTLFNIFLNDLPDSFDPEKSDPVVLHDKTLNCIMYADHYVC